MKSAVTLSLAYLLSRTAAAAGAILYCLGFPAHAAALSADDEHAYRQAFDSAHKRHFDLALTTVHDAHDRLLAKVLEWQYCVTSHSGAGFADITAFMRANPDWPQQSTLQRRAEEAIGETTPNAALLEWFDRHAPVSAAGTTAYAKALIDRGRSRDAADLVRAFWVSGSFDPDQEGAFVTDFAGLIRGEDDLARLDRLLWDRQEAAARRQMARVDADHKLLAQARLAFLDESSDAEAQAGRLPPGLKDDPGLIYEWVRYLRSHDRDDDAIELLRHPAHEQVRPDLWWTERAILARRALQKGNVPVAYDLAQNHGRTDETGFAEAEWLSGWIALRFLKDPVRALDHFTRLYDHVVTPRSRSRAAYWAGRAAEAQGQGDDAVRWFNLAAPDVTTFYGQLAASHLRQDPAPDLPADPVPTAADLARFEQYEMPEAARLLTQIGEGDLARFFLVKAFELAQTPGERELAAQLAASLHQEDIAVFIARQEERQGVPMVQAGYPVVAATGDAPEPALVLSLIRKESGFHAGLVSGAGAEGLMQLLPATAAQIAKALKVTPSDKDALKIRLTRDPSLNVRLGSSYVGTLLDEFGGSYLLTAAAYNAGPNRVRRWLADLGDPRAPGADPVDWIESIPYWETRDYIQRVLEATQIYRRKLGAATAPQLDRDLRR
jgi:soluble lytic murein transglycosylase